MFSLAIQGHNLQLYNDTPERICGCEDTQIYHYILHLVSNSAHGAYMVHMVYYCRPTWSVLSASRKMKENLCEYIYKLIARCIIHISRNSVGMTSIATNTISHCSFLIHILPFLLPQSITPFFALSLFIQPVVPPLFFSLLPPLCFVLSMSRSVGGLSFSEIKFILENYYFF